MTVDELLKVLARSGVSKKDFDKVNIVIETDKELKAVTSANVANKVEITLYIR